jgi:SAM-dependent methyltransferase
MLPWWVRIAAKMILARTPVGYSLWQRLGLFRHGDMDATSYLQSVFDRHIAAMNLDGRLAGRTLLELGPGDSIGTAVLAACHGASTVLIDAGAFAVTDVRVYQRLAEELACNGLNPPDLASAKSLGDVLDACRARYLPRGLASFEELESGSVDLIFSQAVLEHVRKHEFQTTLAACRRVIKPAGICSHRVDLMDHLGGGLNNLRFSERAWESDFFVKSGFYTNRIRCTEMLDLFHEAGFAVDLRATELWDTLPIIRKNLDSRFSSLGDDELCIKSFDVILQPVVQQ